jgi:hypothetical protein
MENYDRVYDVLEPIVVGIQIDLDCCETEAERARLIREKQHVIKALFELESARDCREGS